MPPNGEQSETATLAQARAHARAQAGFAERTLRTVPPSQAADLPPAVDPATVVWDETLDVGGYCALRLPRHSHLHISDLGGDACIGFIVYNAGQPSERLNVADTVKVQWQAYLDADAVLLSDMGRALMTIVADSSRRHDALCGATNRRANERRYGDGGIHCATPAARELFTVAGAKYGLDRRDLPPSINWFKGVRVMDDGTLEFDGGMTAPAGLELRADLDVIVIMVNSPHPLDPRGDYSGSLARITAWRGAPPPDPIETAATPERRRAYENNALYLGMWAP